MSQYVVVRGDIIGSKKLANRAEVQVKLEGILADINQRFAQELAVKFEALRGDEIQGVLFSASPVYDIMNFVLERLAPVGMRFGAGLGSLAGLDNRTKTGEGAIEGEAFDLASEALEEAHKITGCSFVLRTRKTQVKECLKP